MKYLDIIYSLREVESEIDQIETEIISEFLRIIPIIKTINAIIEPIKSITPKSPAFIKIL